MTSTPCFGEFLGPAAGHIAAAVSFRSQLPYDAQRGVVRQLDRVVATLGRYLADLPDVPSHARAQGRDGGTQNTTARLALGRAARSLRPAVAGIPVAVDGDAHPAVGHLCDAVDHLAVGRDLLHTHFTVDPVGTWTGRSYWAPVITSGPVTAALLAEFAGYAQTLTPWIAGQSGVRRVGPGRLTWPQLALRNGEPWLQLAGHGHARRAASALPPSCPRPPGRHPRQRPAATAAS